MGERTAEDLAREAARTFDSDPRRADQTARTAIALAQQTSDLAAESRAWRALGMSAQARRRFEEALRALRLAVRRARAVGDSNLLAEARASLAYVLFERGSTKTALAHADQALAEASGFTLVRVGMQRSLILARSGRYAEALAGYRDALPVLRQHHDEILEARLLNNRGLLYVYSGNLDAAEADLRAALAIRSRLGLALTEAATKWNLGFVAARRGDVPEALRWYDATEQIFAAHGSSRADVMTDRAEVLLSVGLSGESLRVARRAVRELEQSSNRSLLAEALVLLGQAALADGDTEAAREAADRAVRMLTRQRRPAWAALARYVALRAIERAGKLDQNLRRRALLVADNLAAMGWRAQELDARIIAARVALEQGRVATVRRELVNAGAARRGGPTDLRIRAWHAEALLRLATGDRRGAGNAVRAGLRVLERGRAVLGATELRAHIAGHGTELAELGLVLARESGSPRELLDSVERFRAGALRTPPVRPPDDAELARALADVRRVAAQAEEALLTGSADARALSHRRAAAEERVRRLTRRASGTGVLAEPPEPPKPAHLAERLGERVLVEMVTFDDAILAITLRDGELGTHQLGAPTEVRRAMERLRFSVRQLAAGHGTAASLEAARDSALRAATRVDQAILAPLASVLEDRELVIVPTGMLRALPWALLPTCVGRPVSVAPSATVWARAAAEPAPVAGTGKTVLVCGPGLAGASGEVAALAEIYPTAATLGPNATVDETLRGLNGAGVAHLATHGVARGDNPLFSSLTLADGPLTVYDLERLPRAPGLVVLPACLSGMTSQLAGEEMLGLTSALFALGTRATVAALVPVPDAPALPLMVAFHTALLGGAAPAMALVEATAKADRDDPATLAALAAFVCFGAG